MNDLGIGKTMKFRLVESLDFSISLLEDSGNPISKKVSDFFHEHSDLIKNLDLDQFYHECEKTQNKKFAISVYQTLLRIADVDFLLQHSSFIPDYFFSDNKTIHSIIVPNNIVNMGILCFANSSVQYADLSQAQITDIPVGAFYQCTNLRTVNLPKGLQVIDECAFYECPITKIDLPEELLSIGRISFQDTKLKEIHIPKSVVFIGDGAFDVQTLTDVYLSKKLYVSLNWIDIIRSVPHLAEMHFHWTP